MYSHLASSLIGHKSRKMGDDVQIEEMRRHIMAFRTLLRATLDEICENGCICWSFICWVTWSMTYSDLNA